MAGEHLSNAGSYNVSTPVNKPQGSNQAYTAQVTEVFLKFEQTQILFVIQSL